AIAILFTLMFAVSFYTAYFSEGLAALDTLDFWVGQTLLFVIATYEIIMFSWVYGAEKLVIDANKNSIIRLPRFYSKIWRYFTPAILVAVFAGWFSTDVLGLFGGKLSYQISNLTSGKSPVALASVGVIALLTFVFAAMIFTSKSYKDLKEAEE
ncbi:MAG: hypothetical protein J6P03_08095, partial [Opitutales bacterium]|nr:hypothetical protein [Opitutales bacterium]